MRNQRAFHVLALGALIAMAVPVHASVSGRKNTALGATGLALYELATGHTGTGLLAQLQFLTLAPSSGSDVSPFNTTLLNSELGQLGGVIETGTQVTVTDTSSGTVPEPGTCALIGLGLVAAAMRRGRTPRWFSYSAKFPRS